MKFTASTRKAQGTGASRRLRRADKLPGIVYGGKVPATPIELDHNEIFHALRKGKIPCFHSRYGIRRSERKSSSPCFSRCIRTKPQVLHIDFQRIAADEPIHMHVPLHFIGEEKSPAVIVEKANVTHTLTEIEVACFASQPS